MLRTSALPGIFVVLVFGAVIAPVGSTDLAPASSAQAPPSADGLCNAYNSFPDVFVARVVGRDHVQTFAEYMGDAVRPPAPVQIDAVRAVVLDSLRGDLKGKVLISPPEGPLTWGATSGVKIPSFEIPLEVGESYLFFSNAPRPKDAYLMAAVFPATDANLTEVRRRMQMSTAGVSGQLGLMPIFGSGLATFLGRVIGGGNHDHWTTSPSEAYRVAVVEPIRGITPKELSILVPYKVYKTPAFAWNFNLENGQTYLFVTFDEPRLQYVERSDGTRTWYQPVSAYMAVHAFRDRDVPLEVIRHLGGLNRPGEGTVVVIGKAYNSSFEARAVATARSDSSLEYRLDHLLPGNYAFAAETDGIVFTMQERASVRSGGCLSLDLVNTSYIFNAGRQIDCTSKPDRSLLCSLFPDAQFIFNGASAYQEMFRN